MTSKTNLARTAAMWCADAGYREYVLETHTQAVLAAATRLHRTIAHAASNGPAHGEREVAQVIVDRLARKSDKGAALRELFAQVQRDVCEVGSRSAFDTDAGAELRFHARLRKPWLEHNETMQRERGGERVGWTT